MMRRAHRKSEVNAVVVMSAVVPDASHESALDLTRSGKGVQGVVHAQHDLQGHVRPRV